MLRIRSLGVALALTGCVSAPPSATDTDLRDVAPQPSTQLVVRPSPAVASLDAESRAELSRSPVPMLVLPASFATGSRITVGAHWSALAYHGDGMTISLHATRAWHDQLDESELAELPPPGSQVRGEPAWETENEGILSLAWNEHDVAYALEIECERPFEDTRCTESAFLTSIAHELVDAHLVQAVVR